VNEDLFRGQVQKRLRTTEISICHVASGDNWAGAEAQVASLLRALVRRGQFRLLAIVLNEGRLAEEARRAGVEVKVLPESQMGFLRVVSEATQLLRGKGIQIVHSHRYKENILAALLARRCDIPFVVRTQHGRPEPFRGLKRWKQGLLRWADQLVARYGTDRLISVSSEMSNQLSRNLGARKVVTIHNGIDLEQVRSSFNAAEAKGRLGVSRDWWLLGTAGRLEPVKRLDIFLGAAKLVAARLPNARFAIAGHGSEESKLRELARSAGLTDRVLFLGYRDDIYDVLRAFDVLILCSDHEGLPMVLLEALYLGVPVIARPVGGITEVLQDGLNGVLVDPCEPTDLAEACLRIITDEVRRDSLARAGVNFVAENFTIEHTAEKVTNLYSSLSGIR
jgi:glycosyltransferase involved in cell wall biosynthesis